MVEEKEIVVEGKCFLGRISNLPMMTAALDQLNSLYSKAKETKLVGTALQATEAGVGFAFDVSKPVVGKFDKQIGLLNEVACSQLDKFEEKFPIITKPTEEVVQATLDYGHKIMDPVICKVASTRDYGAEVAEKAGKTLSYGGGLLSDAKNFALGATLGSAQYGCSKVKDAVVATGHYGATTANSVKGYGTEKVNQVKEVVSCGAETLGNAKNSVVGKVGATYAQMGSIARSVVNDKLVAYEVYLDHCCPPGEEEEERKDDNDEGLIRKLVVINDKTHKRVNRRIMREIRSVLQKYQPTRDIILTKIGDTKGYVVAVPGKLTTGISSAKDAANGMVSSVTYELLTKTSALVAAANGLKERAESAYKKAQQDGVIHPEDIEKYLSTGKDYGQKLLLQAVERSGKVASYLVYLPKNKYNSTKEKVLFIWSEVNKSEEEVLDDVLRDESANHSPESSILEKKLIATTRHVIQKSKVLGAPVLEFLHLSGQRLEEVIQQIKKNMPEVAIEKVVDTSFLQVSIAKMDVSKLLSGTYSSSAALLKKIYAAVWELTIGKVTNGHLAVVAARAIEEIPLVRLEDTSNQSRSPPVANHEEIRNIDDVSTDDDDAEEDKAGSESDDDVEEKKVEVGSEDRKAYGDDEESSDDDDEESDDDDDEEGEGNVPERAAE